MWRSPPRGRQKSSPHARQAGVDFLSGFLVRPLDHIPRNRGHQENPRFSGAPGYGVPAMAARVADEGEALQQARYTTTSTEEEGVRPWMLPTRYSSRRSVCRRAIVLVVISNLSL